MDEPQLTLPPLGDLARWSVTVRDAATSTVLAAVDADAVQDTASVGKVFLLLEVARRAEDGTLDLDEQLSWHDEELVADSGLWHLLRTRRLPVADLCVLVGAVSDNLATNVLLRHVGLDAVRRTTLALGVTRSGLLDRVRDARGPEHPPALSRGNAGELSEVMARLHRGELGSSAASRQVLRWLASGTDLSMVAAAFGLDPLAHTEADRGLLVVDKTGTTSSVRADVGLVTGPRGVLAFAALAQWDDVVGAPDPRDRVLADLRAVGEVLRGAVTGEPPHQSG